MVKYRKDLFLKGTLRSGVGQECFQAERLRVYKLLVKLLISAEGLGFHTIIPLMI